MARVYAIEERTGRRWLVRIECDASGCTESIRPHPTIAQSGWTKTGYIGDGPLGGCQWDWCPAHERS